MDLNKENERLRAENDSLRRAYVRPDDLREQVASLESGLRNLADEAQILVNIIRENTRDGICTLHCDMTIGTRKAIEAARKYNINIT